MINKLFDFHTHSTHSDGGDTPYQLVERARNAGVEAMALTDHHNHTGLPEFLNACKEFNIFGIPFGAEISAELSEEVIIKDSQDTPDLVILGKNPKIEPFMQYQKLYKKDLKERHVPQVIEGLKKVGFIFPDYDLDKECRTFKVPPQIIHSFIYHKKNLEHLVNYVHGIDSQIPEEDIKQNPIAYLNRYLFSIGSPAYAKRVQGFNVDDAVTLTKAMNCVLILAHPGGRVYGSLPDFIIDYFITKVDGIEVRNYFNSVEQNDKFDKLAKTHKLIRSGGSDCHGDNGIAKIGMFDCLENQLKSEIFEELWDNLPK